MAVWQSPSSRSQIRSANNFSVGLTTELSPFFTDENAMIDGYGWDFDEYPAIKRRGGMTVYGSTVSDVPYLLDIYNEFTLVRAIGSKLQYSFVFGSSTWTDIPGIYNASKWVSTNFDINGPKMVLINRVNGGYYFNGSTLTAIPEMPKGRMVTSDNLRVYVANTDEHNDYIYYSAFQNALDFTTPENSGFVQFYTPSGGAITGIRSYGGAVWVFKKNAYGIIYHTGDATLAYRLVTMSDTIGCEAGRTIAEVGPYIIFMSKDDVYIGAGDSVTSIGGPIRKIIKGVNRLALDDAFAYSVGNKYYLFLPDQTGTVRRAFVYDVNYRVWLPYFKDSVTLSYGTVVRDKGYTIGISGKTYEMGTGNTDDGLPINWMIQSRPFDEGVKEAEKELWEMHILGRFPSGSTMTVQVSPRDDASEWYPIEYDPTTTSSATQNKNLIVPLDTMPLCNYYSYRLSGTGDVTIQEVQRYSRIQPVQY